MRIALFQPEIAGNVGAVLRLGACLGLAVNVIEPCGFAWNSRALARAGMDYAGRAEIARHADWTAFRAARRARLVLLSTRGDVRLPDARFAGDDVLLIGSESAGVPDAVHAAADLRVRVPMRAGERSLNMAMACALACGEALRQTGAWPE